MFGRHSQRFRDRTDAALQLAAKLKERRLKDPVVLGIPRGGVVVAAVLAKELKAELDVVLARKLRAPGQQELAIGALGEEGRILLNAHAQEILQPSEAYLQEEIERQRDEIERRRKLIRALRPAAALSGRSVIVTDDGIATGATMIAALQIARGHKPHELIVAAPVASPERLAEVRRFCDDAVCLLTPDDFFAIGQFYEDFTQVEDDEMLRLLRPEPKT
jgi:predicted phosphoribosyltransferase